MFKAKIQEANKINKVISNQVLKMINKVISNQVLKMINRVTRNQVLEVKKINIMIMIMIMMINKVLEVYLLEVKIK